jgi:two-component system, sporulation sensor kinase E
LLIDDERHVVLANKAAARLFGMPAAQLAGLPVLALVPRDNLARWLRDFSGQRTKVLETSIQIDGRHALKTTLRIVAVPLAQTRRGVRKPSRSGGRREYRLLVLEDITERAALEQQLVESEKQAAMGQLAAGILHEVANPLAGLGSNLVLVRNGLDARPREVLEQALDVSIEQLNQMRQLLGTLSGFPGRTAPVFETANLIDVVQRSVAFITSEAMRRRIRIDTSFETAITCEMDVRLIRQVLLNVLKNAIEALPDGGCIHVCARICGADRTHTSAALIVVTDSGVGIAEPDLRKVFRPLFSTKPRGAGLGLPFCRQTVEEHGGYIRVASPGLDRGTAVTICLPIRQYGAITQD